MSNTIKAPLSIRLKASARGFLAVFTDLRYVAIAALGILFFGSLVIWSLNLEFARYVLLELPVSLGVRLQTIFWDPLWSIFTTYNNTQALGIMLFSVLSGLNSAMLIYVLKRQSFRNIPKKSGFGGTVFAVLAGGCVACGTSILAPMAATFGATSGAFLRDLSTMLNWAASLLIIYSIYKLGLLVATMQAKNR